MNSNAYGLPTLRELLSHAYYWVPGGDDYVEMVTGKKGTEVHIKVPFSYLAQYHALLPDVLEFIVSQVTQPSSKHGISTGSNVYATWQALSGDAVRIKTALNTPHLITDINSIKRGDECEEVVRIECFTLKSHQHTFSGQQVDVVWHSACECLWIPLHDPGMQASFPGWTERLRMAEQLELDMPTLVKSVLCRTEPRSDATLPIDMTFGQ